MDTETITPTRLIADISIALTRIRYTAEVISDRIGSCDPEADALAGLIGNEAERADRMLCELPEPGKQLKFPATLAAMIAAKLLECENGYSAMPIEAVEERLGSHGWQVSADSHSGEYITSLRWTEKGLCLLAALFEIYELCLADYNRLVDSEAL